MTVGVFWNLYFNSDQFRWHKRRRRWLVETLPIRKHRRGEMPLSNRSLHRKLTGFRVSRRWMQGAGCRASGCRVAIKDNLASKALQLFCGLGITCHMSVLKDSAAINQRLRIFKGHRGLLRDAVVSLCARRERVPGASQGSEQFVETIKMQAK